TTWTFGMLPQSPSCSKVILERLMRLSIPLHNHHMIGRHAIHKPIFSVNANGTLNLPGAARKCSPEAPFVSISTNKVYGDAPNHLPLRELPTRWEIESGHEYEQGISEGMSIDYSKHSLFGTSKAAADLLV